MEKVWRITRALRIHIRRVSRTSICEVQRQNTIEWIIDRSYAMFLEATQVELVAGVAAV